MKPKEQRTCHCGKRFTIRRSDEKFCGAICRRAVLNKGYQDRPAKSFRSGYPWASRRQSLSWAGSRTTNPALAPTFAKSRYRSRYAPVEPLTFGDY
jgi:hypothetical protein